MNAASATPGEADGTALLDCREVTKRFGALAAVDGLSFSVREGEVLGVGGPNGAGKTTLFEVISGLSRLSEGEIRFGGVRIDGLAADRICHAGLARTFQFNAAFDSLSLFENVLVAAQFGRGVRFIPGLRFQAAELERAEAALGFVGLQDRRDDPAGDLPVLHRKLLMIASALVTEPRLLLMDEPVGGLNPSEIDRVLEVVRAIKARGITVLLIEHVMRFLVELSDRVLIMHHGEKLYEGSSRGLVEDEAVVDVYLGKGTSQRLKAQMEAAAP